MRLNHLLPGGLCISMGALMPLNAAYAATVTTVQEQVEVEVKAEPLIHAETNTQAPIEGSVKISIAGTSETHAASPGRSSNEPEKFGQGVVRRSTVQESAQRFALELRMGPYYPDIDADSERTSQQEFFGTKDRLFLGVELDWQFYRIPYFGTAGVGGSIGYVSFTGLNQAENLADIPDNQSISQESTLTVIPMSIVGVLRIDEASRRWPVPFVPYAKLGFGYALWSVHDGVGISRTDSGDLGRGRSMGLQAAIGGMFLLDFLEPSTARALDVESGINNSYLFFEWSHSSLTGMNVGSSGAWLTGIALEM